MFIQVKRFQLLYKVYFEAQRLLPAVVDAAIFNKMNTAVQKCREYENSELTDQMCFGNAQKDVPALTEETDQINQDIVLRKLGVISPDELSRKYICTKAHKEPERLNIFGGKCTEDQDCKVHMGDCSLEGFNDKVRDED